MAVIFVPVSLCLVLFLKPLLIDLATDLLWVVLPLVGFAVVLGGVVAAKRSGKLEKVGPVQTVVLVVVLSTVLCGLGGVGWMVAPLVKGTVEAGRGDKCPECAVYSYFGYGPLGVLGGDEVAFDRALCDGRREVLRRQAQDFSSSVKRAAGLWKVSTEFSVFDQTRASAEPSRVVIDVRVLFKTYLESGKNLSGETHRWVFTVVDEDGWRVCGVEAPEPCRDLIVCGGPSSVSPSPLVSEAGRRWDTRVPWRCLPDSTWHDLLGKECPTPPEGWVQPGPAECAPDQPGGIPLYAEKKCAALGWIHSVS